MREHVCKNAYTMCITVFAALIAILKLTYTKVLRRDRVTIPNIIKKHIWAQPFRIRKEEAFPFRTLQARKAKEFRLFEEFRFNIVYLRIRLPVDSRTCTQFEIK